MVQLSRIIWCILLLVTVSLVRVSQGSCTGIEVSNVSLGARDSGTGNAPINFDISWNNSWRSTGAGAPAPNNWDAAWVFVKFRKNGGDWAHASLSDTGHTVPSGASLDVGLVDTAASYNISSNPGVGVFIYRSADGTGTFSKTGFSLIWKFAQNGVGTGDTVDIRVYAIEMVYIPDGSFFAGDNATSNSSFKQGSSDNDPWYIGSESAITTANAAGTGTGLAETAAEYYYVTDSQSYDEATGAVFTIPAGFPKGYRRFYLMKGEVSQSQWVSFFNTLTATQRSQRDITSSTGKNSDSLVYRNNVSWNGTGDASLPDQGGGATYGSVAANYLSYEDLTAYLDWAGLRPMSELEFERAGRGPYRAVSGEYAWGSTLLDAYQEVTFPSISNPGTTAEAPPTVANHNFNRAGVGGPMRVGAMAHGDATRVDSGAGYYGNMDLSGNLWETTVSVGVSAGRGFEGRYHGNGSLNSSGDHDVSMWPGQTGYRGGSHNISPLLGRLSDRSVAGLTNSARSREIGGRGARTAP